MNRDLFNKVIASPYFNAIPFWEVWFGKYEMQRNKYGAPDKIENTIRMAKDLGMSAVNIGGGIVDTNSYFGEIHSTEEGKERYSGGTLCSLDQLEQRPLPNWEQTLEDLCSNQKKVSEAGIAGIIYLPWCFHRIATGMGLENFCYKLIDDFNFLKTCMHWIEERNRKAIRAVISEVKPDAVLFDGDCAYKTGLMIKPQLFKDLVYDETVETVSLLKELNIPYTFHTDGKLDDLIPFLIEWGFSAVHGCEKQANDLSDLIDKFGDSICLIGNMDVVFLASASVPEIRRETEKMLIEGSRKGRFIAACNTSPQDYIPDENYLAFCDVIKNFGSRNR